MECFILPALVPTSSSSAVASGRPAICIPGQALPQPRALRQIPISSGRIFFSGHSARSLVSFTTSAVPVENGFFIENNLADRFFRVVRATLNSVISKAEDPEKMLEQAVNDMTDDLIKLRKAAAEVIAGQKLSERQLQQAESNAKAWTERAQMAVKADNDELAREALKRKKTFEETANSLRSQLETQRVTSAKLTDNIQVLEGKLNEARTKKDMYIARARSAKTQQKVSEMLGTVSTSSSLEAFERMEQKVLSMEAQAEAIAELSTDGLAEQFKALERGSEEDELRALKAQMGMLPASKPKGSLPGSEEVEAELEKMKKSQY